MGANIVHINLDGGRPRKPDGAASGGGRSLELSALEPIAPVDELIEQIYRGPLERAPWKSFLRLLRRRTDCDFAAITVRANRPGSRPIIIMDSDGPKVGRPPSVSDHARLSESDPLIRALSREGDVLTLDETIGWDHYREGEFYRDVIHPYGVRYQIGMNCAGEGGWTCHVGLMNAEDNRPFGEEEKSFLKSLRPHLQIAVSLFARVRREEMERTILSETLDRLGIAAFFIGGGGRVVATNAGGHGLVKRSVGFGLINNRLVLDRPSENEELEDLVINACERNEDRQSSAAAEVMSLECDSGERFGILVRPVDIVGAFDDEWEPRAVVYVSDVMSRRRAPERLIARLFGLTSREAVLVKHLANGLSLTEAATILKIKENTVRTYARRIFEKVGVNRQPELVRRVLTSVVPLA